MNNLKQQQKKTIIFHKNRSKIKMFPKLDLKIKQPISGKTFALLIGLGVPGLLAIYYVLKQKNADSDSEGGFLIRD